MINSWDIVLGNIPNIVEWNKHINMKNLFIPYYIAIELHHKWVETKSNPRITFFANYRQWDGCEPYLYMFQDWTPEDTEPYTVECNAPLYEQVFTWFREEHQLMAIIENDFDNFYYVIQGLNRPLFDTIASNDDYGEVFKTYEEAEDACIIKLLELI